MLWSAASEDVIKNYLSATWFSYRGSLRYGASRRQSLGIQYQAAPCQQAAAMAVTAFLSELFRLNQEFLCFPAFLIFSDGSVSLPSGLPAPSANTTASPAFTFSLLSNTSSLPADISEWLCTSKEEVFVPSLNLSLQSVLKIKALICFSFVYCTVQYLTKQIGTKLSDQAKLEGHPPPMCIYIYTHNKCIYMYKLAQHFSVRTCSVSQPVLLQSCAKPH